MDQGRDRQNPRNRRCGPGRLPFNDAASALYAFTWNTFCDWYLEFTKPIFDEAPQPRFLKPKATYAWALDQCLILLHPIMPFITEELWGKKARPKPLIHSDWPTYTTDIVDADADAELNWVIRLIENIRSARAQMHVPAGAYVPLVSKGSNTAHAPPICATKR